MTGVSGTINTQSTQRTHHIARLIARNAEEQGEKIERKLRRATIVAHFVSPIVAITFAVVYWVIGMQNVMYPGMQQEI